MIILLKKISLLFIATSIILSILFHHLVFNQKNSYEKRWTKLSNKIELSKKVKINNITSAEQDSFLPSNIK